MSDPFPDPPISQITFFSIVAGHRLIYLGHGATFAEPLLTMDWVPADGSSRVWRTVETSAGSPDPFPTQGAQRTFASVKGDVQVLYLGQSADPFGQITPALVMGFSPSIKQVRVWQLDRAGAGQEELDVDYLLPKTNDSLFSTIGPGHQLTYLDHDAVLDWEPASGHARVWQLDRSRTVSPFPEHSTQDPLPIKTAETTFSTIRSGHELVYLGGDTVLDRDRASGLLRVWSYDRNVSSGDFLPNLLHEVSAPGRFAPDEQLVYLGRDRVLALAPTGVARVFDYDRIPTEDPLTLARTDAEARALPWISVAREAVGPAGTSPPSEEVDALLRQHFRYQTASIGEVAALELIRTTLEGVEAELASMANIRALSKRDMKVFLGNQPFTTAATRPNGFADAGVRISPGYRHYGFTGGFFGEGRGDEMRAATLIHEFVHFVSKDNVDSAGEGSPDYDTISGDQAIHNPSTYCTFARHVATGEELRFGLEPWR